MKSLRLIPLFVLLSASSLFAQKKLRSSDSTFTFQDNAANVTAKFTVPNSTRLELNRYLDGSRITVYDPIAWYPPTTNGADLVVLASRDEVYAFDQTTAETLYVKMDLHPQAFTSVDSIDLLISTTSTSGDSAQFVIGKAEIAADDDPNDAIAQPDTGVVDLGSNGSEVKRIRITSITGSFSAGSYLLWRIYRDTAVANNSASDVRLHLVRFYWH